MAYAYIDNGVVKECFRVDPFRIVTPGYAALFVEVSDEVEQGWIYDGETFSPPVKVELDLAMAERSARNQKLAATDWTQLPDVPEAIRNTYTAYRQALRDVPAQEGFPNDIIWPAAPGT